ncbi:thrombomodulin-like [Cheilinus undulatus]|uniref:thrombomodulin-like n=1 Tax=Cheilinus undulatus TaxID=241271 RepID=UPI001BD549D2|nr:thrombomodulin-like [Cheilinus undulatus]
MALAPHTARAFVICVFILLKLEETVLSQRGYCTGNTCFVLYQEQKDFQGAEKSCKDSRGQVFVHESANKTILSKILRGLSGRVWLEQSGKKKEEAGRKDCFSLPVFKGQLMRLKTEACQSKLVGFLCQYTYKDTCRSFNTNGGTQVNYTSLMVMDESETFPPGTLALVITGGEVLDSRHVCHNSDWLKAPWQCDMLKGGCDHSCNSTTHTCTCPAGQSLHANNISCTQRAAEEDKCAEQNLCTGVGEECVTTQDGIKCRCRHGFIKENGVCLDNSICDKCEQMCDKFNGVSKCYCREGFKVTDKDPTKCEQHCAKRQCLADCMPDHPLQCHCPDGFIVDTVNGTRYCTDINECDVKGQCEHKCVNQFGRYFCLCDPGFKLIKGRRCVPVKPEVEEPDSSTPYPTIAGAHAAIMPYYIKTGSVLGITVFMLVLTMLLYFLVRNMLKRCGKFQLTSIKQHDIDIFYLQQATTDTYKMLPYE